MAGYELLIKKLDDFIRKYYLNQVLRGSIYFVGLFVAFILLVSTLEHFGRFSPSVRAFLFFSFILINLAVLARLIVYPLSKMYQLGKLISNEEAARIIGKHFSEIKDRLTNTLELKKLAEISSGNAALIEAGIEQRVAKLTPVPFSTAIDLGKNKKYLKFALIPLALFGVAFLSSPRMISESTVRIVDFDSSYLKPMPFKFIILPENQRAVKNEDFVFKVQLEGEEIPSECYIEFDGNKFKMHKVSAGDFKYTFSHIQQTKELWLEAGGFRSSDYLLEVIPRPVIKNVSLRVSYPNYLNLEGEKLDDVSDVIVPEGSKLTWEVETEETKEAKIIRKDSIGYLERLTSDKYKWSLKVKESESMALLLSNEHFKNADSMLLSIRSVKDEYPQISAIKLEDSLSSKLIYFKGQIKDDHGFSRLAFVYTTPDGKVNNEVIIISNSVNNQNYYHVWDLSKLELTFEDEISYCFEVFDNDGVNGPKASKSHEMTYKVPSKKEIRKNVDDKSEKVKEDLEASIKEAKEIQKDLDELNKKLLDKKKITWQEKKQLQEILQKQKNLQKNFEEIKNENERNNFKRNEFSKEHEELREKQKQLEELMEKLMDDEMKKMMDEIQKLMEQMNKEQLQEKVDEMKLDNKDLEKELDRSLELFKQLEFEMKLQDAIDQLKDVEKKQRENAKETENKDKTNQELDKKQDEIKQDFEDAKKTLEDLKKKNEALENKQKMPNLEDEKKKASDEMKKAGDEMKQGRPETVQIISTKSR